MTHDAQVATTWGKALADLRDKVANQTGWSTVYDDSGGATALTNGNKFVWETPTGEYVEITTGNNSSMKGMMYYGDDYDTVNGSWNNKYPNVPAEDGSQFDCSQGNILAAEDDVEYWLTHLPRGFVFYTTRVMGDGNDADTAIGWAEISPLWDFTAAKRHEAEASVMLLGATSGTNSSWNYMGESHTFGNKEKQRAEGIVNPDPDIENYPIYTTNVVYSDQYNHANGYRVPIGSHDLWAEDKSEDGVTSHQDTVDDGSGNKYVVLDDRTAASKFLMRVE